MVFRQRPRDLDRLEKGLAEYVTPLPVGRPVAIELGPQVSAGAGVDELGVDPHLVAARAAEPTGSV
jgi:hypothetical protein